MKNIKAVIDTNIFISCPLKSPINLRIYKAFRDEKFQLVASARLFEELKEVFQEKELKIDPSSLEELLHVIKLKAIIVETKMNIAVCRDPEDDFILEMAMIAKATHIVTRDKDLLTLQSLGSQTTILAPEEFLKILF